MKIKVLLLLLLLSINAFPQEGVILVHGLIRSSKAMAKMEKALEKQNYIVFNIDYPSTTTNIATLSKNYIGPAFSSNIFDSCSKINFVTHSMGGILTRYYFKYFSTQKLGRVVMLGPPNKGSRIVDALHTTWIFKKLNGPAGDELGTGSASLPNSLGPVNFDLGIIAGDRSINWINSSLYMPGKDDGKVSVENTKVSGMNDWILMHVTHTFMSQNSDVIKQTIYYLKNGKFIQPKVSVTN